jgi:lysophospholipase L1-like esterase
MTTWLLAPRSGATFTNTEGKVYTGTLGVPVSFADADVTEALAQGWTYSDESPLPQLGKLAGVPATLSLDSEGNPEGLINPKTGKVSPLNADASIIPYKLAFWGDSRYNGIPTVTTTPDTIGSASLFTQFRTPAFVIAHMGDAEFSRSYGVSGDQALNWASTSRSGNKTFTDLARSNIDAVFIQYGVNDIDTGAKTSAQVISYLRPLVSEIIKSGKFVVFESIIPINSPIASATTKQVTIDEVNASMAAWIPATFSNHAIYVDTASALKGSDNLGSPTYIASVDGVHQTRAGAQLCGKILASAVRALLPKRYGAFRGEGIFKNNLINQQSPSPILSQFNAVDAGTAGVTQAQGSDSGGNYYEWIITPTAVNGNGLWQVRMEANANFQTANPPFVSLVGNEILQGSARITVDDGAGGTPNGIINVELRQRYFTASIFNDWSGLVVTPAAIDNPYTEPVDLTVHTPKMQSLTASVVANPAIATGLALITFVQGTATTGTVRVRVYNAQIRVVAFATPTLTAASFALPATTVAYTNNSLGNQQVTVGGGTVTVLAVNGTTTGLTSGTFILAPGDTLTPTYSVAPTWTVKQI